MREDTANREVYTIILPPTILNCPSNQEVLLYDFFNLSIGDTLNSCTSYSSHPCPEITSIYPSTYGFNNTVIYEYGGCPTTISNRYFEGIGGWDGLFEDQLNSVNTIMKGYCIGSDANCGIITGVEKLTNNNSLNIYPNPNQGVFNIEINNIENGVIEVYNISGQLLLQQNLNKNINQIDLVNQPKGIYFARITTQHETVTKKIVIQ